MADLALVTADTVRVVGAPSKSGILTLQAGVAIAAGQALRIASTGKWALADASSAGTADVQYIATRTVASGMPLTGLRDGRLDGIDLSGMAYGDPVYLSDTLGELADANGTVTVVVGRVEPALSQLLGAVPDKILRVRL